MAKTSKGATVNDWYEAGLSEANKAYDLLNSSGDQRQIDQCWQLAANKFWDALVFGHKQAPYSLSCCFNNGTGVRQDDYIAKLFFGVALALEDPKCQRETNKQIIPKSMNKVVAELTKLVQDTHAAVNIHDELDASRLIPQMMIFDKAIKLPHLPDGMNITKCLLKENFKSEAADQDHAAAHDDYQNLDDDGAVKPAGDQNDGCCCAVQ